MRRLVTPSIVIALAGAFVGFTYRYFADDPAEATLGNYLRSGIHGMEQPWRAGLFTFTSLLAWRVDKKMAALA